jgi:hypothetical protein
MDLVGDSPDVHSAAAIGLFRHSKVEQVFTGATRGGSAVGNIGNNEIRLRWSLPRRNFSRTANRLDNDLRALGNRE